MNAEAIPVSSSKEYRATGIWRLVPFAILALCIAFSAMFVIIIFAMPTIDTTSRIVMIMGALIMLLLGIALSLAFRGTRLVTSPEGVVYYGVGFNVYTPWDNIKGIGEGTYEGNHAIGTRLYQPDRNVEGLLLQHAATVGYKVKDGIRLHIPVIEVTLPLLATLNMNRFAGVIPTATFFNDATLADFLKDARQYAPDALKAE